MVFLIDSKQNVLKNMKNPLLEQQQNQTQENF